MLFSLGRQFYRSTLYTPISMGWIVSLHRVHGLGYHTLQQVVFCLIIPAFCDRACSPLEYSASHTEPTTHWKVPDKPPVQREHYWSCDNIKSARNHASSLPPQFTVFHHNCQRQHLCVLSSNRSGAYTQVQT